jgi:Fe-S cluster biogenesis protein NfuA
MISIIIPDFFTHDGHTQNYIIPLLYHTPRINNENQITVIKMRDKIEKVIDEQIRPGLQMDGGDIEVVDVDSDGMVKVRLKGACGGCPMSQITLTMGVERKLKEEIPEVKGVVAVP